MGAMESRGKALTVSPGCCSTMKRERVEGHDGGRIERIVLSPENSEQRERRQGWLRF